MLYNPPSGSADANAAYVGKNVAAGTQGSKIPPAAVEYTQREIVNAITAAGLAPSNGDLTQLAKAIAKLATGSSATQTLAQAQPIYPEITSPGNVLAFTSAAGQVTLSAGQSWQWRGLATFTTAATVQIATLASKTCHWVWDAPGTGLATPASSYPAGRHSIIDRTGASPIETDPSYDSTYDRMLCARIVTDANNVPTVTPLINKALLAATFQETVNGGTSTKVTGGSPYPTFASSPRIIVHNALTTTAADGAGRCESRFVTNWARTPKVCAATGYVGYQGMSGTPVAPYTFVEGGSGVSSKTVTRYASIIDTFTDWNLAGTSDGNGNMTLSGLFCLTYADIVAV